MKHQILTETKFFKLLDGMDNIDPTQLQVEYGSPEKVCGLSIQSC